LYEPEGIAGKGAVEIYNLAIPDVQGEDLSHL